MTSSEAARHDLYNGLTELLGEQRAETLMAALPAFDMSELVTKSDLAMSLSDLRSEFHAELTGIGARLDRLFLALVGGLIVIVGTMAGAVLMP